MSTIYIQSQYELMEQVKLLASWVNYKICKILFTASTSTVASAPETKTITNLFSPQINNLTLKDNIPNSPQPSGSSDMSPSHSTSSNTSGTSKRQLGAYVTEACDQFRLLLSKFAAVKDIICMYGPGGGVGNYLSSNSDRDIGVDDKYTSTAMMLQQEEIEAASACPILYRHYDWIVNQYLCFVQFLEHFNILPNLNVDTERANYYFNAYKYTKLRHSNYRLCFEKEMSSQKADSI